MSKTKKTYYYDSEEDREAYLRSERRASKRKRVPSEKERALERERIRDAKRSTDY